MRKFYIGVVAVFVGMGAHAETLYRARTTAQVCDEQGAKCEAVGRTVFMEHVPEGDGLLQSAEPADSPIWRVRVLREVGFDLRYVHKGDVEPAVDLDGKPIKVCPDVGGGGVYTRPEVAADGTVRIKRFLITVTCKGGKSYSTTKRLN